MEGSGSNSEWIWYDGISVSVDDSHVYLANEPTWVDAFKFSQRHIKTI